MSRECAFFAYLLEHYADYKHTTGDKILARWDALGLTDLIYGLYEIYHCERLQNAFDDIDELTRERESELAAGEPRP